MPRGRAAAAAGDGARATSSGPAATLPEPAMSGQPSKATNALTASNEPAPATSNEPDAPSEARMPRAWRMTVVSAISPQS